jgi:hypothetical protein
LKEGSGISDIWLQEHIAANIIQYSKFKGGLCKYALKEGSGISDKWLQEHIAENIFQYSKFEEKEKVALVLSPLWASFDSDMECLMPPSIQK